ncbi:MAG: WS/DGAT domain-containing protein [Candidatus Binatia bacterium]
MGAKTRAIYLRVPLLENTGLGIAVVSDAGQPFWGFNADYQMVPDLPTFVNLVAESIKALAGADAIDPDRRARASAVAARRKRQPRARRALAP